jgi:HK97 family phage major capsid protein
MSEFIKAQQEIRANLTEQIRDVIEGAEKEGRGLDAAELEKIDRIEADITRADNAIAVAKRNEERAVEASVASKGFALPEKSERSASDVLREIAATRGAHTFNREERTLVPSANTVPKSFFDEVFDVARLVGPMLDVGQRINTTSGEDITIPTLTAYSTATLKGAGTALDESEPTYSSITLQAYKYGLLIPVSNELIADAGFNISAHLAEQAGNGLGFAVNAALTTGDGNNKPNGVVTAAGSGITGGTGVAGAFTADNLIDLQYSLDGAARRLPGVAYMATGSSIGAMRKLKDVAGNYLYTVNVGQPDNFAGYPVVENPAIAATGTGAKSVLFGHWPSYKVRVAGGIQVASSTDYSFNKDETYFRVMMRVDGDLTHASHIKYFIGAAS